MKNFYSYLHIGNKKNLIMEHKFDQSLEMRYGKVLLYLKFGSQEVVIALQDRPFAWPKLTAKKSLARGDLFIGITFYATYGSEVKC